MVRFIKICFLIILLATIIGCDVKNKSVGDSRQDENWEMQVKADKSLTLRLEGKSVVIDEDKYYLVKRYDTFPEYTYELFNELGDMVFDGYAYRPPIIEYVSTNLISIRLGHGSTEIEHIFYDISKESISISYWYNIAVDSVRNLTAYLYYYPNGKPVLRVRDIFDKTKYFKEIDLGLPKGAPGLIENAEFLLNGSLMVTYYKGEDFVKTTEVILL